MIDAIIKMLGVSKNSYWNYKKQTRPIISFLEKYFTENDLQEFLETGTIKRLEESKISNAKLKEISKRLEDLEEEVFDFKKVSREDIAEYAKVTLDTVKNWEENNQEIITSIKNKLKGFKNGKER